MTVARIRYGARLAVAFPVLFLGFAVDSLGERLIRLGHWLQRSATRIEGEAP